VGTSSDILTDCSVCCTLSHTPLPGCTGAQVLYVAEVVKRTLAAPGATLLPGRVVVWAAAIQLLPCGGGTWVPPGAAAGDGGEAAVDVTCWQRFR
jgi:hypothetical protein